LTPKGNSKNELIRTTKYLQKETAKLVSMVSVFFLVDKQTNKQNALDFTHLTAQNQPWFWPLIIIVTTTITTASQRRKVLCNSQQSQPFFVHKEWAK